MKQRLFAGIFMCLSCIGAWAQQQMTLRLLDHFGGLVTGLTVWLTETDPYNTLGEFTTDGRGEIAVQRTNQGALEVFVSEVGTFVVEWDGTANPVEARLDGYAQFTFRWTDRTPELEETVWIVTDYRRVTGWDENNVAKVLARVEEDNSITWKFEGDHVLSPQKKVYEVSNPARRTITATLGWDKYAALTVDAKGMDGKALDMYVHLRGGNGVDGGFYGGFVRVPAGDYRLVVSNVYPQEEPAEPIYYMPAPPRNISLAAGGEETVGFDYAKDARLVTFSLFGMDGKPLANVDMYAQNAEGGNTSARTDENGVARMAAFPGTYTVGVWYYDETCGEHYEISRPLTVADADVQQRISFADEYSRVNFDIALPPFITDPGQLEVRAAYRNMRYDESTRLYTGIVPRSLDDHERVWTVWNDRMYPASGRMGDWSETIRVDLTYYKANVKFVSAAPAKYRLEEVYVSRKLPDGSYDGGTGYWTDETYEGMYMAPGDYRAKVKLADVATGQVYVLPNPVEFAVGGTDMEVPCTVNEDDFCRLTVTLLGFDGNPLADEDVRVESYGEDYFSQNSYTDESGQAAFILSRGEYHVSAFGYESPYPGRYETVVLAGEHDMTISCEGYRPLAVTVSGDVLADFRIDGYGNYDLWVSGGVLDGEANIPLMWGDNGGLNAAKYLPEGDYGYRLNLNSGENLLNAEGKFKVQGDNPRLDIVLSTDVYHRVDFNVVDENGGRIDNGRLDVYLADGDRGMFYYLSPQSVLYLADGSYRAVYSPEQGTLRTMKDFTVAGAAQTVRIEHRQTEMCALTVRAKLPEAAKGYVDRMYVEFYMNGMYVEDCGFDLDPETLEGETAVNLSAGTYTYEVKRFGRRKEITVTGDGQVLMLDYTASPYIRIDLADEDGQPIDGSDGMTIGSISRDGYLYDIWEPDYFGLVQPGTYDVWGWAYGCQVATARLTVTETAGQSVTLRLRKANPDNFAVVFFNEEYISDEYEQTHGTITLGGFGTYPLSVVNIFADIPAGTYPYTLQSDGFATRTGTVEVSEANEVKDEDMPPHIIMLDLSPDDGPTAIDAPVPAGDAFCIFPTVAQDVLHIAPVATAGGGWTVSVISASGAVMYAGTHDLSAETEVPVASLPEGLYLLRVGNGTAAETHKFVKR